MFYLTFASGNHLSCIISVFAWALNLFKGSCFSTHNNLLQYLEERTRKHGTSVAETINLVLGCSMLCTAGLPVVLFRDPLVHRGGCPASISFEG